MFLARALRRSVMGGAFAPAPSWSEGVTPSVCARAWGGVHAHASTSTSTSTTMSAAGDDSSTQRPPRKFAKLEPLPDGADIMQGAPFVARPPVGVNGADDELVIEEKDTTLDAMMRQLHGSIKSREVQQSQLEDGAFLDPETRDAGRVKEDVLRHIFRTIHAEKARQDPKALCETLADRHGLDANLLWQVLKGAGDVKVAVPLVACVGVCCTEVLQRKALKHSTLADRAVEIQVSEREYIKRAEFPSPLPDY